MSSASTDSHQYFQIDAFAEDKKCRICGFADTKNVNIFSAGNCKLLSKILTVYPIVLYQNDPLPKNICKKCVYNVSFMSNDIQRVMKTQSKWINNVRSVQPNHNYIRVLDLIENSNDVTRESVKSTLGEDVFQHSINRLLLLRKTPEQQSTQKEAFGTQQCRDTQETTGAHKPTTSSFSQPIGGGNVPNECTKTATKKSDTATKKKSPKKAPEIKDIKSILELNGCTLLTVGASKKPIIPNEKSVDEMCNEDVVIKEEPSENQTNEKTAKIGAATATGHSSGSSSMLAPPPPLTVKCRYCPLQFKSLSTLATHQLIHMRLSVPKIFEKKYLHKSVRRGRLIVVQDRKCIRCLNCWRVFVDNKSILDHWSLGECDFYCHICGKEFAQAPKMLREHVPAAHGISYRSSKMHRVRLSTKILHSLDQMPAEASADFKLYQCVSEQEPTSLEMHDGQQSELSQASSSKTKNTAPLPAAKKTLPAHSSTVFQQPSMSSSSTKKSQVGPIKHTDGTVSCHICYKTFNNYKARNSHMRKHKPSYAYGDVVLPPNAGVDVYMKVENDGYYGSSSAACSIEPSLIQPPPPPHLNSSSDKNLATTAPIQNKSSINYHAPATTTCTVVRGVRTKFVSRRSDLNSSAATASLKVKAISDLQNSGGGKMHTVARPATTTVPLPKICPDTVPTIKAEPMDIETQY